MTIHKRPTMLLIADGYGMCDDKNISAIARAHKPNLDKIFSEYPYTELSASGISVGLPQGQMGNSEVGHLNIGAGRIVYQELTRISKAVDDGDFFDNPVLNEAIDTALSKGTSLHIMGLLSDGGVHSHISHLFALLNLAKQKGLTRVIVHCFLDGRDVPPANALTYIHQLEQHIAKCGIGSIGVISGRYYAMDRDRRWDRVEKAYDALTLGIGNLYDQCDEAVNASYAKDITDEFMLPAVRKSANNNFTINNGDSVIMYNFRPDRAREITRSIVTANFDGFKRKKELKDIFYVCMTQYDAEMPNCHIAFPPQSLHNTLGEYLSNLGLTQLRIAETEKYAHVTFFFNGGVEAPNKNEDRILIDSPKVPTYDVQPEMSAYLITDEVIKQISTGKYDFIVLNFANADMVGHTGMMDAAIKAVQALNDCIPRIVDAVLSSGGQILLTADHGNADCMLDKEGNVVTAHSLNPVPLVHISESPSQLRDGGKLADLAPTLLELMGLPVPAEMTGTCLVAK